MSERDHLCIKRDCSKYSWTVFSVSNLFCVPYNFPKQQGCRKRQKVGRNHWPCCSTIFPLCCCVLWRWMWPSSVWPASEFPAAGYTALHSLASYKTKALATQLGFLWYTGLQRKMPAGIRARLQRSRRSGGGFYAAVWVKILCSALASALLYIWHT